MNNEVKNEREIGQNTEVDQDVTSYNADGSDFENKDVDSDLGKSMGKPFNTEHDEEVTDQSNELGVTDVLGKKALLGAGSEFDREANRAAEEPITEIKKESEMPTDEVDNVEVINQGGADLDGDPVIKTEEGEGELVSHSYTCTGDDNREDIEEKVFDSNPESSKDTNIFNEKTEKENVEEKAEIMENTYKGDVYGNEVNPNENTPDVAEDSADVEVETGEEITEETDTELPPSEEVESDDEFVGEGDGESEDIPMEVDEDEIPYDENIDEDEDEFDDDFEDKKELGGNESDEDEMGADYESGSEEPCETEIESSDEIEEDETTEESDDFTPTVDEDEVVETGVDNGSIHIENHEYMKEEETDVELVGKGSLFNDTEIVKDVNSNPESNNESKVDESGDAPYTEDEGEFDSEDNNFADGDDSENGFPSIDTFNENSGTDDESADTDEVGFGGGEAPISTEEDDIMVTGNADTSSEPTTNYADEINFDEETGEESVNSFINFLAGL